MVEYKAYGERAGRALGKVVGIMMLTILLLVGGANAAILAVFQIGCGYSSN